MEAYKILLVRWDSPGHFRNLSTIANYLFSHNNEISIATVTECKREDTGLAPNITWHSFGLASGNRPLMKGRLKIIYWLAREIKNIPHDVLYVFDSWTIPYVIAARIMAGKQKIPWIYHTVDWLEPGRYPLYSAIEKWACHNARVVINTDRTRARLQQALYKLEEMPAWVPNYLSCSEIIPERDENLRLQLLGEKSPDNSILLIHPTIASPARLVIEIIRSLPFVDKRVVLLQIAKDNDYKRECIKVATEIGVINKVIFHEPVSYPKLLQFLKCADISAIFHDHRPSSGYFLCNADRLSLLAACGIPFVASNYPNMEALVYRYGLGECCDPYSPQSIAAAINLSLIHI